MEELPFLKVHLAPDLPQSLKPAYYSSSHLSTISDALDVEVSRHRSETHPLPPVDPYLRPKVSLITSNETSEDTLAKNDEDDGVKVLDECVEGNGCTIVVHSRYRILCLKISINHSSIPYKL